MDPATFAGIAFAFGMVILSIFLEGSTPMSVVLFPPMILVIGGTIGAGLASGTLKDVIRTLKNLNSWLMYKFPDGDETVDAIVKLADKARQLGPELPGKAGDEISERVDESGRHMDQAARHMKGRDPSAARDAARQAADALEKAQEKARSAARQQMSDGGAGLDSEPIKIPGADEYKAPAHFREDILEAMKKQAPERYDEMVKQYYQELIR